MDVQSNCTNHVEQQQPDEASDEAADEAEEGDTYDELSTFVPDDLGVLTAPLNDQGNVDKQAAEWGELWQSSAVYTAPVFDMQLEMFIDMADEIIPQVALTFPGDTGLGQDNIAPRAFTRLAADAIRATLPTAEDHEFGFEEVIAQRPFSFHQFSTSVVACFVTTCSGPCTPTGRLLIASVRLEPFPAFLLPSAFLCRRTRLRLCLTWKSISAHCTAVKLYSAAVS